MRIKLFRAATVAVAMAEIRDVLGLDALILDTVRIEGGVEITAALEADDPDEDTFSPLPGVISFDDEPSFAPVRAPAAAPDRPWSRHNLPPELDGALLRDPAAAVCTRLLRFAPLPLGHAAAPMMLVGPPGSGKTLTIAKLAARLVLDGQTPMVVTADEQRAGAVEQLAGFTRLLGLTLIAAGRPETLGRALARRSGGTPVLIDAPGLDLDDGRDAALLAELLTVSRATPVLVLPAGIDSVEAAEIAQNYAARGVRHLLPTRLDRRGRLGGILAAARAADLALTEAGIGAAVVDGLETLTAERVAERLAPQKAAIGIVSVRTPPTAAFSALPPVNNVLSAHIAAQAGANRTASWKTPS